MSDHEGEVQDDWENMSLPGGTSYSVSSRRGTESLDHVLRPSGPNEATRNFGAPTRPAFPSVEPDYRSHVQALTGIFNRPGGVQTRITRPPQYLQQPVPNQARQQFEAGLPPVAQHSLTNIWGKFLTNVPVFGKQSSATVARSRLDEISRNTNTYIHTPLNDTVHIDVWGYEDDVNRAIAELDVFERDIRRTGLRPVRAAWHKHAAYDGRVEDRAIRNDQERLMTAARFEANKQTQFEYQGYLLWPFKIDMNRFREKHEGDTLQQIQSKMLCSIDFYDGGTKYVKISTQEENDIHRVYFRMLNLIRETVAETGLFSRVNSLRLPRVSAYRDNVGLDLDTTTQLVLPTLHGDPLPSDETEKWQILCKQFGLENQARLRDEVTAVIQAIQAPGQQVRMRLTFTELGFRKYSLPPAGREHHTFDSFCEMLREPLTDVVMAGLREPAGVNLGNLVPILSAMPQFSNHENRYTLHFDFDGSAQSILRLEREMFIGMHGELEDEANRWLQFPRAQNESEVLQFNMLDFEHLRANYQVHIGKTNIYEAEEHERRLQSFSQNVAYTYDPQGLQAEPLRRAVYPPGYGSLVGHKETTIARFNFKGPDARFELVRRDNFAVGAGKEPTSTLWFAQYYYPEWDSLLGEFGTLKPGQQVSWPRNMESFFIPPLAVDDNRPLPRGFNEFMKEVEEIQELLQDAIEQLAQQTPSVSGVTNGVSDMHIG